MSRSKIAGSASTSAPDVGTTTILAQDAALGKSQTDGVATAADVEMAAGLPAAAHDTDPGVSLGIANLLRDPKLVTTLRNNAEIIDDEGETKVEEVLARLPGFIERFDAFQRLTVSTARVRESLVRDNADFSRFTTAVANVQKKAGRLSPLKRDASLKKLVTNRAIQRGLPKMVKTKKKNALAKKKAAKST